jgi:hypothetical protein
MMIEGGLTYYVQIVFAFDPAENSCTIHYVKAELSPGVH